MLPECDNNCDAVTFYVMIEAQNNFPKGNPRIIAERYSLEGFLASYGFVELYQALDRQLGRPVTLQVLTASAAADPATVRAFSRHQKAASSIYHCNILAVYDAGKWEGRPFSVMERSNGVSPGTLFTPGSPPDIAAALRITRQTAEALKCCREGGLPRWTFSPVAVTVDSEGNARLAIFEGLGGPYASSTSKSDPIALGGLLRIVLSGQADSYPARHEMLPTPLLALLDRLQPGADRERITTNQLISEISALEQAALQPTEAYALVERDPAGRVVVPIDPSDAPTIAAQVLPATFTGNDTETAIPSQTLARNPQPIPKKGIRNLARRPLSLLAATGVMLALIAVAAALWPKPAGVVAQSNSVTPNVVGAVASQQATPTRLLVAVGVQTTPQPTATATVAPPQVVEAAPAPEPPTTDNGDRGQSEERKDKEKKGRDNDDD